MRSRHCRSAAASSEGSPRLTTPACRARTRPAWYRGSPGPVSLAVDHPWTRALPPISAWGAIIALALLCTALGYVLYFRLIERAGATNALLVTLLVPPVAIVLGAMFLGETLAPQDFAGLGLIALGLAAIDGRLLTSLSQRRLRQPA